MQLATHLDTIAEKSQTGSSKSCWDVHNYAHKYQVGEFTVIELLLTTLLVWHKRLHQTCLCFKCYDAIIRPGCDPLWFLSLFFDKNEAGLHLPLRALHPGL